MNVAKLKVSLNNLRIYAYHGVAQQENRVGNTYYLDVELDLRIPDSFSDNLDETVNYASVCDLIEEEMRITSKLLETVAWRICNKIIQEFTLVEKVSLSLKKENPPMEADIDSAGVYMEVVR